MFINKKNYYYRLLAAYVHKLLVMIGPEREMRRTYYKTYHRYPNITNPRNLIEKIFWMQLHADTSMWTKCADKYAMREYVEECGYKDNLPMNYGRWDNANDIDFESLPNEFVLKSNNGCGTVLVVRNKSELDINSTRIKMKQWLKIPFGWAGGELHYTRIKPCIIAEELLHQDEEQKTFSPGSIVDYKVWCIAGDLESILVVYDRNNTGYSLDLYDTNWNRINGKLQSVGHCKLQDETIPRPICLTDMLSMAKKIAKPFPEVRVDFYIVDGKPIIGELTFSTGYGYFTDDYYNYLGSKIDLSKVARID